MGQLLTNFQKYVDHPIDVFFETGTYQGDSLGLAIGMGCFKEYHSVELSSKLFRKVSQRYRDNMSVFLYCGKSPDILLNRLDEEMRSKPTLFWLDAHYQGVEPDDQMDLKYGECPLMYELTAINFRIWQTPPVIVIDDARMFTDDYWEHGNNRNLFKRNQWPSLEKIQRELPGYKFAVEDDQVICYC